MPADDDSEQPQRTRRKQSGSSAPSTERIVEAYNQLNLGTGPDVTDTNYDVDQQSVGEATSMVPEEAGVKSEGPATPESVEENAPSGGQSDERPSGDSGTVMPFNDAFAVAADLDHHAPHDGRAFLVARVQEVGNNNQESRSTAYGCELVPVREDHLDTPVAALFRKAPRTDIPEALWPLPDVIVGKVESQGYARVTVFASPAEHPTDGEVLVRFGWGDIGDNPWDRLLMLADRLDGEFYRAFYYLATTYGGEIAGDPENIAAVRDIQPSTVETAASQVETELAATSDGPSLVRQVPDDE